jgi:hypothetical protein
VVVRTLQSPHLNRVANPICCHEHPSPKLTPSERYITLRALSWLFQLARLRIYLATLILATLVGAFYAFENWRGNVLGRVCNASCKPPVSGPI